VYERLVSVRAVFDDGLRLLIETRNEGALPVLEILTREVEQLMRDLLSGVRALEAAPSSVREWGG